MKGEDRKREDEFREKQTERYRMSPKMLRSEILRERGESEVSLFGKELLESGYGEKDGGKRKRYTCEILVLKRYVEAKRIANSVNRQVSEFVLGSISSACNKTISVRRKKEKRSSADSRRTDAIIDVIDIGKRIEKMDTKFLRMLLEYYIAEVPAKEMARERGIGVAALGGKISAARRELRRSLGDMLTEALEGDKRGIEKSSGKEEDARTERRRKVKRLMERRMSEMV